MSPIEIRLRVELELGQTAFVAIDRILAGIATLSARASDAGEPRPAASAASAASADTPDDGSERATALEQTPLQEANVAASSILPDVASDEPELMDDSTPPPKAETRDLVRDRGWASGAVAAVASPEVPAASEAPRKWSDERKAALRRDYPAGVGVSAILSTLNALPGPSINAEHMAAYAKYMGLRRPAARAAPPPAAPRPSTGGGAAKVPVIASREAIIRWGAERGLDQHQLDLPAVNRKRAQHGMAPFALAEHGARMVR